MTLQEWTTTMTKDFQDAGFKVSEHQGFPLVEIPKEHLECVRFLKFHPSMSFQKRMYSEGCLILPAGLDVAKGER